MATPEVIYFITSNSHKFAEAKAIIPELEQLSLDLLEIQELDPQKIIQEKLREARKQQAGSFVVDDVSLCLHCIKNLPGPLTKWFGETLQADGVADLVHRYDDHRATVVGSIGYAPAKGEIKFFEGRVEGTIVKPRGEHGWGFDPIFLPNGHEKTCGEMTPEEKNKISHRGLAFRKLAQYLVDSK
ncbi:MAG: non-canonical purine NTP pyrophosphatase [Patescibacteria group bacterium]